MSGRRLLIRRSSLTLTIMLVLSLRIDSLVFFTQKIPVMNYLPLFIGCFYLVAAEFERRRITFSTKISVLFFFYYVVITLYISKSLSRTLQALVTISAPFAILMLTEYYAQKDRKQFVGVCLSTLVFLICIDIISFLAFKDGLYSAGGYSQNWFLGYKTARVRSATMPAILLAALCYRKESGFSIKFYLICIVACVSVVLSGAVGGLVSQIVLILVLWLMVTTKKSLLRNVVSKILDMRVLATGITALNIVMVVMGNTSLFSSFIIDVLGKDLTLAGRTRIWSSSVNYFFTSPVLGHGFIFSSEYETITGNLGGASPHNLFLSIAVYTGAIGATILLSVLIHSLHSANKIEVDETTICAAFVIAILLLGITSNNMFGQFNFAVFTLLDVYYEASHNGGKNASY